MQKVDFVINVNDDEKQPKADAEEETGKEDATTCLISPNVSTPNISIGRMYVYNFSPVSEGTATIEIPISSAKLGKLYSPATSSGPICRICHEGDGHEDLVSPCYCSGTLGLVHLSCIERWLGLAGSDKCEICNYLFRTMRSPGTFTEWIKSNGMHSDTRRSLMSDLLCFCLLTPLATISTFLSVEGAMTQVTEGNSLEAGCLMALATFLITIYLLWNILALRFHAKKFIKWRYLNQKVKVLKVKRSSCDVRFKDKSNTTPIGFYISQVSPSTVNETISTPGSSSVFAGTDHVG